MKIVPCSEGLQLSSLDTQTFKFKYLKVLVITMGKGLRKRDVYIRILKMVAEGKTAPEIRRTLGLSPSNYMFYEKNLIRNGYIVKYNTYPRTYALTSAGKSALENPANLKLSLRMSGGRPKTKTTKTPEISVHDVKVKIPILRKGDPIPPDKETAVRNWTKKYYRIDLPVPVTIEETTKNLILHFHELRYPRDPNAIGMMMGDVMRYTYLIATWLNAKYGWVVDVPNARVILNHIAIEVPEVKEHLRPGTEVVFQDKKARAIDGKELPYPSKAWIDNTPSERNAETWDLDYTEAFLRMPFTVEHIYREQSEFFRLHNELIAQVTRLLARLNEKM